MDDSLINNISYTAKDFQLIYPMLIELAQKISPKWNPAASNESDAGVLLIKMIAAIADMLNYNIDKNVLECFPVSVTQEANARELFEQLGYNMKWYQGGTSQIAIRWTGDTLLEEGKPETTFSAKVPMFTMVADSENSTVFTITSPTLDLPSNGEIQVADIIQGIAVPYTLNGSDVVYASNLDSNNRLYFLGTNVAENGVFITNVGAYNYSEWHSTNNIATEPFRTSENTLNRFYKFGVTPDGTACYIEFPENAQEIIGSSGINITYIRTDGEDGNIGAYVIEKLYTDVPITVTDANQTRQVSMTLDNNTVQVVNVSSIRNGKNPESISDAYKNYKKTIGTYDTLVTLRDYNDAVQRSEIVSNGFVCDRTNDIQTVTPILTRANGIEAHIKQVATNPDIGEPYMDAFSLKMYLLQWEANVTDAVTCTNTFNVLRDFSNISDTPVETLMLYMDDEKSIQHDFQALLADKICMLKNKYPIECRIIPQYKLTAVQSQEVQDNILKALYATLNSKEIEFGQEMLYDVIYDSILTADERIKAVALNDIVYTTYAVYYDSAENKFIEAPINTLHGQTVGYYDAGLGTFYIDAGHTTAIVPTDGKYYTDLGTGKVYQYTSSGYVESTDTEIQNEIYAKAVLNGNTQLFVKDGEFLYSLGQEYKNDYEDIEKISTNVNIIFDSTADKGQTASYTLRENETIQLFAANLIEKNQYTFGVRYQYQIGTNIPTNSDYMLKPSESIIFFWKEVDDDAAPYQYEKFGEGTIFSPNFAMPASGSAGDLAYIGNQPDIQGRGVLPTDIGRVVYYTERNGDLMPVQYNQFVKAYLAVPSSSLTETRTITTKEKNYVTLDSSDNNSFYWILNTKTADNKYVLFEEGVTTRTLNSGEYLIYTNAAKTSLNFLGAGTRIDRALSNMSGTLPKWECIAIDYSTIVSEGITALEGVWQPIQTGVELTITEQRFISLGEGATLTLSTLNQYSSSYYWGEVTYDDNLAPIITVLPTATTNPNERETPQASIQNLYAVWKSPDNTPIWWWSPIPYNADTAADYTLSTSGQKPPIAGVVPTASADYQGKVVVNTADSLMWECKEVKGVAYQCNRIDTPVNYNEGIYVKFHNSDTATGGVVVTHPAENPEGKPYQLGDFDMTYTYAGEETVIPKITINSEDNWNGRSLLGFNASPNKPQKIVDNQTIVLYDTEGSPIDTLEAEVNQDVVTPLYLMPDAEYNMAGGSNVDVTRLNEDNSVAYMKAYVYKSSIDESNTQLIYDATKGIQVTFNAPLDPVSFRFNLPQGQYIIPVANTERGIGQFNISVEGYYNERVISTVQLGTMGSGATTITGTGYYYFLLDMAELIVHNGDDTKIPEYCVMSITAVYDTTKVANPKVLIEPIVKFTHPDNMDEGTYQAIWNTLRKLDETDAFYYSHPVDTDIAIENPLRADSFLDSNHPYKEFTICQLDINSSDVYVTNKVR